MITYFFEGEVLSRQQFKERAGLTDTYFARLPPGIFGERDGGNLILEFVGIIAADRNLIICLPKYLVELRKKHLSNLKVQLLEEARFLIQVLRHFDEQLSSHAIAGSPEDDMGVASEPLIALEIIEHFLESGYWQKSERTLVLNGDGETDWRRTCERCESIITEDSMVYVDWFATQKSNLNDSIILILHKWAVRYCLEKYSILFPHFDNVDYDFEAEEDITRFGSEEFLSHRLQRELSVSFRDSDITVLTLILQLIDQQSAGADETFKIFGTTKFHRVWEVACKISFKDRSEEVKSLLPVPIWKNINGDLHSNKQNRLIPDIIWYDNTYLLIADAKYYRLKFDSGKVVDNPGISDILKQVAYKSLVERVLHTTSHASINAFIFPRALDHPESENWLWGHIDCQIPGLETSRIAVFLIPPKILLTAYLNDGNLLISKNLNLHSVAKVNR